jgi:hypothetical protein
LGLGVGSSFGVLVVGSAVPFCDELDFLFMLFGDGIELLFKSGGLALGVNFRFFIVLFCFTKMPYFIIII